MDHGEEDADPEGGALCNHGNNCSRCDPEHLEVPSTTGYYECSLEHALGT